MKNYIEFCCLSSSFPGSFIKCMDKMIDIAYKEGIHLEFVFPEEAKEQTWCQNIASKTDVYYVNAHKAVLNMKTYRQIFKILKAKKYDIIHSHYEAYDVNLVLIKKVLKLKSRMIWHLHCFPLAKKEDLSFLRKVYYEIKYRIFTKNVDLITINDYNKKDLAKYAKKAKTIQSIINGIDFSDLKVNSYDDATPTFITLGWDFFTKGDDIILDAAQILAKKGYQFKLMINGNEDTYKKIQEYLNMQIPDYFIFQYPVFDRNDFFNKGEIFLQASRNETFSYGVCEASYAGKYVICSNALGMKWATYLPNVHTFQNEDALDLASQMEYFIVNKMNLKFDLDYVQKEIEGKFSDIVWIHKLLRYYEKS